MKTQLLDKTLGDIFVDDGFNILDNSNETDLNENTSSGIDISGINLDNLANVCQFSNIQDISCRRDNEQEDSVFSANKNLDQEIIKQNKTAWGDNLNKKVNVQKVTQRKSPTRSSSFKSNDSLFKSQTFSIRNPRKSLLKSNSQINLSHKSELAHEFLPDLETVLSQKAREHAEVSTFPSSTAVQKTKEVSKEVDMGWLERTSSENGLLVLNNQIKKSNTLHETPKQFGLENIDMEKLKRLASAKETKIYKVDKDSKDAPQYFEQTEDDANEFVGESDNEDETYRQLAKRRKLLPLINPIHDTEKKIPLEDLKENVEKVERNGNENSSDYNGSKNGLKPQRKELTKMRKTVAKKVS